MSKSPNSDIIDKIYFRNIYSCQRKIYWYKVKVMETIEVVRNFFPDNSILEYKLDNETQDPRNYEDDVVRLANLNNYAQFVFLQLKVLWISAGCRS